MIYHVNENNQNAGLPCRFAPRNDLFAFTLSEVLITLGIIGVVAALTIPTLLAKHETNKLINQLSVAYTVLEQGFSLAINDLGTVDSWTDKDNRLNYIYKEVMPKYFKVVKDCGTSNGCKLKSYKNINGTPAASYGYYQTFLLANGMTVSFYPGLGGSCTLRKGYYPGYGYCADFFVDVNGNKGPNVAGKDLFYFQLGTDILLPGGSDKEDIWTMKFEDRCSNGVHSAMCTAWVLYNKNMDYLKCQDLSWNGKHSCDE
ncbi:MAG: type II secretion system protein [Candidatus Gastranaerophilaceae bacterium]